MVSTVLQTKNEHIVDSHQDTCNFLALVRNGFHLQVWSLSLMFCKPNWSLHKIWQSCLSMLFHGFILLLNGTDSVCWKYQFVTCQFGLGISFLSGNFYNSRRLIFSEYWRDRARMKVKLDQVKVLMPMSCLVQLLFHLWNSCYWGSYKGPRKILKKFIS